MRRGSLRPAVIATLAVALFRVLVLPFLTQPGYSDAFYYFGAARRLTGGQGLTVDFVWNFIEAPGFPPLPIPSHRFWMPLASALQAAGIALFGSVLDALRSAQLAIAFVAIAIVPATYVLARRLDLSPRAAALVAFLAGLGGIDAAAWSSLDYFAPLALAATLLLAALPGIAAGRPRDAVIGGLALGAIVLARSDGALYAVAPLLVAGRRQPRLALATIAIGALVALPWFVRDATLGLPEGQLARAAFLVRYEDFFAIATPTLQAYLAALDVALAAKLRALGANGVTFLFATFVVLGPLAVVGAWRRRAHPIALGWLTLAVLTYLVQSLVFTLHSTQGSYPHSLAGLVPATVAIAVAEGARWLTATRSFAAVALGVGGLALSVSSIAQWPGLYDPNLATRRANVASGDIIAPAMVIDAPAWRYVLDGPAIVTPADGLAAARDVARRYGVRTLVLEAAHFSAYDPLYRGAEHPDWLEPVRVEGLTKVWRVRP